MGDLKVLIIGHSWPEPKATAAGVRMMELIQFFLTQGYNVSFGSTSNTSEHTADLQKLGVQPVKLLLNHHSFDDYLHELKPNVVIFDRFITEEQFGWRVNEFAPNAIKILDTEDLHSLRSSRKQALDKGTTFKINSWLQNDLTKREVASIYRCDLSLIISEYEMQLLEKELKLPSDILLSLPYMLDPINMADQITWLPFDTREHFIFIGTGKHPPNIDAIKWLKSEIWPLIRKALPKAELHVYGAYLPKAILELDHPAQGFLVKGRIADADLPMSRARVNLVPLRYGAGIKGKLIQAMYLGTPSVATKIGAEGVTGLFQNTGCSNTNAAEFAAQSVLMYTDREVWHKLQLNGVAVINNQFNKSSHYETLRRRMAILEKNVQQHRANNFIGSMLQHHTMAGNKYMAKWIASKNALDTN